MSAQPPNRIGSITAHTAFVTIVEPPKEPTDFGADPIIHTVRYDNFVRQLFKVDTFKEMVHHAKGGVCEEAGEISDVLKRHITYGEPLNKDALIKELGDCRFYLQAIMNMFEISEQEVLQTNADKLSKRYVKLTYSNEAASARADGESLRGSEPNQ